MCLVGGFTHGFYFPLYIYIWDVILLIDFHSIIFQDGYFLHHQPGAVFSSKSRYQFNSSLLLGPSNQMGSVSAKSISRGSHVHLTGAFYVGLLDGLLGVAGMMTLLVINYGSFPKIPYV